MCRWTVAFLSAGSGVYVRRRFVFLMPRNFAWQPPSVVKEKRFQVHFFFNVVKEPEKNVNMKRSWWKHTGSCLLIRNYIFCLFSLKWDVSIFCFHVIPWPSRCLIIIRKRWLASMCCCWLTVNMTALKILNWFCFVFFLKSELLAFSCRNLCRQLPGRLPPNNESRDLFELCRCR